MNKFIDYTGKRVGRLNVLLRLPNELRPDGYRRVMWLCQCDCGKTKEVASSRLGARWLGRVSCGCLRSETTTKRNNRRKLGSCERLLRAVVRSYRAGARRRGVPFSLNKGEVSELIFSNCHYCGDMRSNMLKFDGHDDINYSGIDRVNNELGYEPGNVVPCCWVCNQAKADLPIQVFMDLVQRIYLRALKGGRYVLQGAPEVESL